MAKLKNKVYVVFDTNVFVRAIAGKKPESTALSTLVEVCHCLAVSDEIMDQYKSVIREYGFTALVVILEGEKLRAMGMLRHLDSEILNSVDLDVNVNHKDRLLVKAAVACRARYLVSSDARHVLSIEKELLGRYKKQVTDAEGYERMCHQGNVS